MRRLLRSILGVTFVGACGPSAEERVRREEARAERAVEAAAQPVKWREHVSEPCGFAVELSSSLSTEPKNAALLDQIAAEDGPRRVTLLAACGDIESVSSPKDFLDVTSRVVVDHLHGRIDSQSAIELQGRPGVELRITIPAADRPAGIPWAGDVSSRLRLIVSGRRQYHVQALHPADAKLDELVDHFFASFRLLDSAPAAPSTALWKLHDIGGVKIEAPGEPVALPSEAPDFLDGAQFRGETGRTPYAMSLWRADRLLTLDSDAKKLRAHFVLTMPKDAEIVSETDTTTTPSAGERPALDVVYRPNIPPPDHLMPTDPAARKTFEKLVAEDDTRFQVRLVVAGDRIVQLLATDKSSPSDTQRFFDSLTIP